MTEAEVFARQETIDSGAGTPLAVFCAYGVPMPMGSKTALVSKTTGRIVLKDGRNKESQRAYREWCAAVESAVCARRMIRGYEVDDDAPLLVRLTFFLPRPASAPRRVTHPVRKPDLDKLARCVLDCLTRAHAIADDARIVLLIAEKRFASDVRTAGCDITLFKGAV